MDLSVKNADTSDRVSTTEPLSYIPLCKYYKTRY